MSPVEFSPQFASVVDAEQSEAAGAEDAGATLVAATISARAATLDGCKMEGSRFHSDFHTDQVSPRVAYHMSELEDGVAMWKKLSDAFAHEDTANSEPGMVLPDRIELSTSPLPMECSTTELRQHARNSRIGPKGPCRRPVLATRTPLAQARGGVGKGPKRAKIGVDCRLRVQTGPNSGPIRFHFAGRRPGRQCGRIIAARPARRRLRGGWAKPNMFGRRECRDGTRDGPRMQDDQDKRAGKTRPDVKDSRQQRLKLALRENLKRRKSQARGRSDEAAASSESADASLDDAGGEKPGR